MEAGSVNQDPETDSGTVLSSDSSQTSQSAMLGDSSTPEQVGQSSLAVTIPIVPTMNQI